MNEQQVIEQLSNYKNIVARMQVLEKYSVGNGITVSRLNQDDQLQELHSKLRGMPSYMYLTKREQQIENAAHAYLSRYPAGTKAQLQAVPREVDESEDDQLLRELRGKIKKVIEARTGARNDLDAVLERLAEFQDLQKEKAHIDNVLEALNQNYPTFAELIRVHYFEGKDWREASKVLGISQAVFFRSRIKAISKFEFLAK